MDAMLLGETLATERTGKLFGFWMPAGGNDGVAAIQVFALNNAADLVVTMESKSSDDDDSSPAVIGTLTITSTTPAVHRFGVAGAHDLVRYTIEFGADDQVLHFQLLQPTWAAN